MGQRPDAGDDSVMRAIILSLLLAGCASHNMRETTAHGDLDRDGCIAIRCEAHCRADATPEQIAAFHAGVIDADELKQLRRFGWALGADAGSTIAALSLCTGARELNPAYGSHPTALTVVAVSGAVYLIARHDARTTPYWCSSARPIRIAANIRTVAAISNVATLAGCGL